MCGRKTNVTCPYMSSFRFCASSYVKAILDAMTDLVNRTFTMSADGVSSYINMVREFRLDQKRGSTNPDAGERQAFHVRPQGAQVCAKQTGQHIDPLVHKVHCRPPGRRFVVHWGIGMDKVGHVGNVCVREDQR